MVKELRNLTSFYKLLDFKEISRYILSAKGGF